MGIGLLIAGRTSSDAAALLEPLEAWFRQTCVDTLEYAGRGQDENERPALYFRVHPCTEDVEISAAGPDRLVVSAKTSTAGPGYHRYLCRLLQRAGAENGVEWLPANDVEETQDDTGYFHSGDAEAVDQAMLDWAGGLARQIIEISGEGHDGIAVSMPAGRRFEAEGVITPLGPKPREWFEAVAENPEEADALFPWWDDGFDARYYLGRALTRMWLELRWGPALDEEDRELLRHVAELLARAYQLDPGLAYPWREWKEILGYLGEKPRPEIEAAALSAEGPLVGYRRSPLRVDLPGGWSIRIPGSLKESLEDDGRWSAWEPGRSVWFVSFSFAAKDGRPAPDPQSMLAEFNPEPGERIPEIPGGPPGVASFGETLEDGRPVWRLEGRVARPAQLGVVDVFVEDPSERAWAVDVWRSIRHS